MNPMTVALLLLGVLMSVLASPPNSGSFVTPSGSDCHWFDLRLSHERVALATACVCKDVVGKSQSYGCQYIGDLYNCPMFKKDSKRIFQELSLKLKGDEIVSSTS